MSGNNIKVVVRCRPLNTREKARGAQCLIRMEGNKTILSKPASVGSKVLEEPKAFTFDQSYWSADKDDIDYADQEKVFNDLGKELLDHAFNGYNCCIFAYGQTGSGKSYSMVGYGEDKGITPRTCLELFERIENKKSEKLDFQVEVSYIEIYNEKVRDLLNPRNKNNLKVREHPVLGPYVQDLSRLAVNSFQNIEQLMDEGNKARTVAATNMNETSSRSHAVFTIFLTQKILNPSTKQTTEKVARISLVDLAGSERANSTGATGVRLKEGANINKSLTTLGKVIAGLAEQASAAADNGKKNSTKKSKEAFVPFRDSVLTWLLKDSLGGNSKTCMIAAISPADYDETLSTLRYADQAKKIKTKAVVNEDPNAKLMRELKDEVEALRQALMVYAPDEVEKIQAITHPAKKTTAKRFSEGTKPKTTRLSVPSAKSTVVFTDASGNTKQLSKEEMVEQLQTTERLLGDLNQTWEDKLRKTEQIHVEREQSLKKLGITIEKNQVGLYTPKEIPYLINLNEDPLMSECLMYNIMPGITHVDQFVAEDELELQREDESKSIRLSGSNINKDHCYFENKDDIVTLYSRPDCTTMVNGRRITEPKRLKSGYRIILGDHHVFRFNNPSEALKERETCQQQQQKQELDEGCSSRSDSTPSPVLDDRDLIDPTSSPHLGSELMDWKFARREAMLNTYINDPSFEHLTNEDLDKLFDDVAKVRIIRKRQSTSSDSLSRRTSSCSSLRRSFYSTNNSSIFLDDTVEGYYTTDTSTVSSSSSSCSLSSSSYLNELMFCKDAQDADRKRLSSRSHRMSRSPSYYLQSTFSQSLSLTPKEKELATKVIQCWKRKRNIAMAQAMLTYDFHVRQANALAAKANKDVFYQFAVVHDTMSVTAVSHWETANGQQQQAKSSSVLDTDLVRAPKPCIAIQVVSRKQGSIYLWSVEKFMVRLRCLQGSYHYASDPKKYLKGDDLFYEPARQYSLLGLAKVPLRNLMTQVPVESTLSVHCRNTGRCMGQLRVVISPIARSVRHPYQSGSAASSVCSGSRSDESMGDEDRSNLLHVGQQLVFEISIIDLAGLDTHKFSEAHAQFRLSTFGSNLDGVFATDPVDFKKIDGTSVLTFDYHQTLSMAITEDILKIIKTQDIVFEVYGKPRKEYLEALSASKINPDTKLPTLPKKESEDVIARIKICEMTPEGEYKPVPVESPAVNSTATATDTAVLGQHDTFCLQQGQQRRIVISLQSSASLDKIVDMRIGQARLMTNSKHRQVAEVGATATGDAVILNLISSVRDMEGTCTAEAAWDSSLHDTKHLNAVTAPTHKVGLTLSWTVRQKMLLNGSEVDTAVRFERDVFVHIKDQAKAALLKKKQSVLRAQQNARLSGSGGLFNFFSNIKSSASVIKDQTTSLYTIEYRPELLGGVHELLSNSNSLLIDYNQERQRMMRREERDATRYALFLSEQLDRLSDEPFTNKKGEAKTLDAKTVLDLWSRKTIASPSSTTLSHYPVIVRRWIAQVQHILIPVTAENSFKRGFLMRKKDDDSWGKCWCVFIGRFMFLYADQSESNEIDILHIRNVQKDGTESKTTTVFTVDTLYDSHTFQAPNNTIMCEWVAVMDY
ncbi:MAG: hypothetical protein EXX96DRAFT_506439 [Benjaminiella poitrasii]|nr:MAG: hypothetical protein EXX96DRAFT_506439 [Benjaminiella poitrasii]